MSVQGPDCDLPRDSSPASQVGKAPLRVERVLQHEPEVCQGCASAALPLTDVITGPMTFVSETTSVLCRKKSIIDHVYEHHQRHHQPWNVIIIVQSLTCVSGPAAQATSCVRACDGVVSGPAAHICQRPCRSSKLVCACMLWSSSSPSYAVTFGLNTGLVVFAP